MSSLVASRKLVMPKNHTFLYICNRDEQIHLPLKFFDVNQSFDYRAPRRLTPIMVLKQNVAKVPQ